MDLALEESRAAFLDKEVVDSCIHRVARSDSKSVELQTSTDTGKAQVAILSEFGALK